MTFLTIFRVTEILCSFRLTLEAKAGHQDSEFLEKFLAVLLYQMQKATPLGH